MTTEDVSETDQTRSDALTKLGQLAKQRREELGLSRAALAKAVGIGSDSTIQAFEFGNRLPQGKNLRLIELGLDWKSGMIDRALRDVATGTLTLDDLDMAFLDGDWWNPPSESDSSGSAAALLSDDELLVEMIRRCERWRKELVDVRVASALGSDPA
jgi:transcriptional regulator with XRE-family HTH domain